MSGTRRTVAVLFERFGPYHKARLESTGVYLKQNNWSVLGVELALDRQRVREAESELQHGLDGGEVRGDAGEGDDAATRSCG